ncbi:hypothetical protein AMECASPLE_004385 [Ameca splendens]|uniref:Uncharacterized protein n=1 Tax=Ameca splendens TaxID=208324 RepID=A0ABV0XMY0_9TELE
MVFNVTSARDASISKNSTGCTFSQLPCLCRRKKSLYSLMLPPPRFTMRMTCSGCCAMLVSHMVFCMLAKSLNLVSSDQSTFFHIFSLSPRWHVANCEKTSYGFYSTIAFFLPFFH